MPEPININSDELASNFDSELDLTVLENKENEILEDCKIEEFIKTNNNNQEVERTPPSPQLTTSKPVTSNSVTVSSMTTTRNINQPHVINNSNQENALNKLLQKIRQQREDSNVKMLNKDASPNGNTPLETPKHASRMSFIKTKK
jgi:hypothetical protein